MLDAFLQHGVKGDLAAWSSAGHSLWLKRKVAWSDHEHSLTYHPSSTLNVNDVFCSLETINTFFLSKLLYNRFINLLRRIENLFLKLTQCSIWSNCGYLGSFQDGMHVWLSGTHCIIYWRKNNQVILSQAWGSCVFLFVFFFLMRVDFVEGLFGCYYCFQGVCLLGFCFIFHLHDIFLGNLFQVRCTGGPC